MSREAREKLVERIYKQQLRASGRLPNSAQKRVMEQKAARVAERTERKKNQRTGK